MSIALTPAPPTRSPWPARPALVLIGMFLPSPPAGSWPSALFHAPPAFALHGAVIIGCAMCPFPR